VRNKRYHGLIRTVLGYVEPSTYASVEPLLLDPRIEKIDSLPSIGSLFHLVRGFGPIFLRFIATMLRPVHSRESMNRKIEKRLRYWRNAQMELETVEEHIDFINRLLKKTPETLLTIIPKLMAGIGMFFQLKMRAEKLGLNNDALNISRGLPNNVTTEMDLLLWEKVQRIRADAESRKALEGDVAKLVTEYRERSLPNVFQVELDDFLDRYGMRGVAEIDIGSKRWSDDPSHIIQLMQTYLLIDDPEKAPDVVFKRMADSAEASLEKIAEEAEKQGGWFSKRLIKFFGFRERNLAGLGETPKFFIINILYIARRSLLKIGEQMVANGALDDSWDIFYLHLYELDELQESNNWRKTVAERKKQQQIDSKKNPPRIILSDGHVFYGSTSSGGNTLTGSPVSPGVVEGRAHVLLDPVSEKLLPGEILVCPATDPAWTPLFMVASGLVMEVGGLMTHGSIVAREYGIPAIVGVSDATTLIKTGQMIRVDGERGTVVILD
jgi:pyruvate,water dikinase